MRGIVLIFILYWYGISVSKASGKCSFYAALGGNFNITLEHKNLRESDELTWKKNSEIVYKKRRTKIIEKKIDVSSSGSLQLIDLKMTDSANYSVEVFKEDGTFLMRDLKWLCVIEKILSKPHIQHNCSKSSVTLTCSVGKPNDVKYVWHKNKKEVKEYTKTLTEEKKKFKSSDTFSCNVSNEVSYQKSDDITISCPDGKLFGLDFWVMIAILATGGGLILILILVLVVCVCRQLKQKKAREREEEELRLTHMMQQAHPPRPHEAPRSHAAPYAHPQNGEEYTPPPPRPRGKRPRPPPVPVTDEEKPPPRPKPRQSAPRHNRT